MQVKWKRLAIYCWPIGYACVKGLQTSEKMIRIRERDKIWNAFIVSSSYWCFCEDTTPFTPEAWDHQGLSAHFCEDCCQSDLIYSSQMSYNDCITHTIEQKCMDHFFNILLVYTLLKFSVTLLYQFFFVWLFFVCPQILLKWVWIAFKHFALLNWYDKIHCLMHYSIQAFLIIYSELNCFNQTWSYIKFTAFSFINNKGHIFHFNGHI